jgi:pimeloyl-ACP methyl ester carboxylesterase
MAEWTRKHPGKLRRLMVWAVSALLVTLVVVNLTIARLPAMPPSGGEYVSLHGIQIHYLEQPGPGAAVVMIHGQPGSCEDFGPIVANLAGLHLISIDRPGYGWSKGGWLPYQEQIGVVHELLNTLKLTPAVLVGHSLGGTLALGVARRYPHDVAGLVLAAPAAGGLRSTTSDLLQARLIRFSQLPLIHPIVDATVGNVIKRYFATPGAADAFTPAPVDPAFERQLLSVGMSAGNLGAWASDELEFDDTSRWVDENVPQIRAPAVIIAALGDQVVGIEHVRRLAQALPGSELITVDGNHMIPFTHPGAVATHIRRAVAAAAAQSPNTTTPITTTGPEG